MRHARMMLVVMCLLGGCGPVGEPADTASDDLGPKGSGPTDTGQGLPPIDNDGVGTIRVNPDDTEAHVLQIALADGTVLDLWGQFAAPGVVRYLSNYRIQRPDGWWEAFQVDASARPTHFIDAAGYLFRVNHYRDTGEADVSYAAPDGRLVRTTIPLRDAAAEAGLLLPPGLFDGGTALPELGPIEPGIGCRWGADGLAHLCRLLPTVDLIKQLGCESILGARLLTPDGIPGSACAWPAGEGLALPANVCENNTVAIDLHCASGDDLGEPVTPIRLPTGPDTDGDGFPDNWDNCPTTPNPDQADPDQDGFGSACDNCPDTANLDQADLEGDGLGDLCDDDDDGDDVPDSEDLCPRAYDPAQTDTDGDGIGDACQT